MTYLTDNLWRVQTTKISITAVIPDKLSALLGIFCRRHNGQVWQNLRHRSIILLIVSEHRKFILNSSERGGWCPCDSARSVSQVGHPASGGGFYGQVRSSNLFQSWQ